jgi:hypothetical protein
MNRVELDAPPHAIQSTFHLTIAQPSSSILMLSKNSTNIYFFASPKPLKGGQHSRVRYSRNLDVCRLKHRARAEFPAVDHDAK